MNQHLCPFSMRPCKAWSQNHLRDLTLNRVEVGNEKKKKRQWIWMEIPFFFIYIRKERKTSITAVLKKELPTVLKELSLLEKAFWFKWNHVYVPFKKYFKEMLSRFIHIKTMSTLSGECYISLQERWVGSVSAGLCDAGSSWVYTSWGCHYLQDMSCFL